MDPKLNTTNITQDLIDYIVDKIVREFQPEKIILFGSYARGDYNNHSDLDLFIIKDSEENSRKMGCEVDKLLWGRKFPVDIMVRKPREVEWNLQAENPFYIHHIFKYGKVLYEKK